MSKNRVLHIISQSHLDPVWLWPTRDGAAEALCTMRSAVDRAAETPSFRYSRSSAATYRWAKEMDSGLFAEIKRLVGEGRWEVVGGWVEQPDCNIPAAESFVRQALYAKKFLAGEFGEAGASGVGYVPDSFGHAGGLPQILVQTGYHAYAFMRPEPSGNSDIPLLFQWESPDGSRVLGIRIPIQYSQSYAATADDIEKRVREAAEKAFAPGFDVGVMWFGVGNHGGGPTREHIARLLELQNDPSLPELRFSSAADFAAAVRQAPAYGSLPVFKGELGHVLRGCYSATGEVKALNRAAEKSLYAAEALAVMENPAAIPEPALADAWWRVLFNQFHDILAGTCVHSVQEETRRRFGAALAVAAESKLRSCGRLARRVDTTGEPGAVVFAANPLPWPRRTMIQYDTFTQPHGREEITHLETRGGGEQIPIQWLSADANFGPYGMQWGKLTAMVDLPACGYRVFRVASRPLAAAPAKPAAAATAEPDNPQFAKSAETDGRQSVVALAKSPALASLPNASGVETLAAPVGTVVVEDLGDTWGFKTREYRELLGRPEITSVEMLEDGGLLSIVRQKSRWRGSEVWMDVVRWKGSPNVELRCRFNWQERRAILKLEVPTNFKEAAVYAAMPAETAARPANGEEYPCLDWVALEGKAAGAPAALALVNDSSHSYDAAADGVLRMILARGAAHAEHPPFNYTDDSNIPFLDQGWQERRFLLVPIDGGARQAPLDRLAMEFQVPAEIFPDSAHPGDSPWEHSALAIEPESVAVMAVKPAENGKGVALRFRETRGQACQASGSFLGKSFKLELRAWEIKTLALATSGDTTEIRPTDALERPITA